MREIKKLFRNIFGFIVVSPFMVVTIILSLFLEEKRAIEITGPIVARLAKQALKFWIPKINNSQDFDIFSAKMKKNFRIWKLLYDIKIEQDTSDLLKLHISNCPFCEVLNKFRLAGLSEYVCEGDWEIAKENTGKWLFERNFQIGTGDSFCDHTYKRFR